MTFTAVVHSEWLKIRSLHSLTGSLLAVLVTTAGLSGLAGLAFGQEEADNADFDPLFSSFFGLTFGQIAAISFGAMAFAHEYRSGGIRVSLAAVPHRGLWYLAKTVTVAAAAFAVSTVTGFASLVTGQGFLGEHGVDATSPAALRAAVACGIYLTLTALLAGGLAALLRSGTAVLGILIPFTLILSFVITDLAQGYAQYLPDQAGKVALHQQAAEGGLGPWSGLAVTAAWSAAALLAGWWSVHRRDA